MELPVYIDGAVAGSAAVKNDGNGVRISVRLRDPGRVVRLSVYGDGELYLGVPEPGEGGLVLEKRLGPAQAASFPAGAAYAAERRLPETNPRRHVLWHGGRPHFF